MNSNSTLETSASASPGKASRRREPEPLTARESAILKALKQAIRKHGQPSLREVAVFAGCDFSIVHRYVVRLVDKGLIEKTRRTRGIRLVGKETQ